MIGIVLFLAFGVLAFLVGFGVGVTPGGELPELPQVMPKGEKFSKLKDQIEAERERDWRLSNGAKRSACNFLIVLLIAIWILSLYGWPMPWSGCEPRPYR